MNLTDEVSHIEVIYEYINSFILGSNTGTVLTACNVENLKNVTPLFSLNS